MHPRLSLFLECLALVTMAIGCSPGGAPTAPTTFPTAASTLPTSSKPVPAPTSISVGEVIHASVRLDDPICDPIGWDANARCKSFVIIAPADGTLTVLLDALNLGPQTDIIDLLLCSPGCALKAYSGGGTEQRVRMPIVRDKPYEITVHLYPSPPWPQALEFTLRTEM